MRRAISVTLILFAAAACGGRPLFLQPRPVRDWPPTLHAAKEAARAGRYAQADSILAGFGARHPSSHEGREAAYWRALLLVDPANASGSNAQALRALNQFFESGASAESYDEATILRRVVLRADSLTRALAESDRLIAEAESIAREQQPAATPPADAPAPATDRTNRNLLQEVRRLREELARSKQELERVRRRLSEQRP